jgi:hypothetical protein
MYHNSVRNISFVASEDLNADYSIGKAVDLITNSNLKVAFAQAGGGFGVLQNQPKAGEHATVAVDGEVQVRTGLAVQAGQYAAVANSGFFINVASTTAISVMGRYLTGAASGMLATLRIDKFRGPTA